MKAESRRLSGHFLLRFAPGPSRWRELLDLGDLGHRQTREQIFQVIERIDTVPTATAQQSVNHRIALASLGMPKK